MFRCPGVYYVTPRGVYRLYLGVFRCSGVYVDAPGFIWTTFRGRLHICRCLDTPPSPRSSPPVLPAAPITHPIGRRMYWPGRSMEEWMGAAPCGLGQAPPYRSQSPSRLLPSVSRRGFMDALTSSNRYFYCMGHVRPRASMETHGSKHGNWDSSNIASAVATLPRANHSCDFGRQET